MATKEQWDEVRAERPYPLSWTLLGKMNSLRSELQLRMKNGMAMEDEYLQGQLDLLELLIAFADKECGIRIGESRKP